MKNLIFCVLDLQEIQYGVLGLWRTQSYCWWKKSCTTWLVCNPVNTGILMDIYHVNWFSRMFSINSIPCKFDGWLVGLCGIPILKIDIFVGDPILGGLPVYLLEIPTFSATQVCKKGDETALEALIVCGLSGWKSSIIVHFIRRALLRGMAF